MPLSLASDVLIDFLRGRSINPYSLAHTHRYAVETMSGPATATYPIRVIIRVYLDETRRSHKSLSFSNPEPPARDGLVGKL
jgi:hypothetical protein